MKFLALTFTQKLHNETAQLNTLTDLKIVWYKLVDTKCGKNKLVCKIFLNLKPKFR